MKSKIRVALLMGGPSKEYDVSLLSGKTVVDNIDSNKYCLVPVVIKQNGLWCIYNDTDFKTAVIDENNRLAVPYNDELAMGFALERLAKMGVCLFFIAMHGVYGEDGVIQGVLESRGMAYTGSKVLASSLAMDKIAYKRVMLGTEIKTADSVFIFSGQQHDLDKKIEEIKNKIGLPCVIKTPSSGSSIGVELCKSEDDVKRTVENLLPVDGRLLVEKYIKGREFTCAVLGNANSDGIIALPPTEIISGNQFFDFDAKYTPGAAEEVTPAQINGDLTKRIQDLAVNVHNIIGCSGMSRTDMIVSGDEVFVLETNTIPGMTSNSLLPKAAKAYGYTITELIDKIITLAFDEKQRLNDCLNKFSNHTSCR